MIVCNFAELAVKTKTMHMVLQARFGHVPRKGCAICHAADAATVLWEECTARDNSVQSRVNTGVTNPSHI
jgi:hypothetical protein